MNAAARVLPIMRHFTFVVLLAACGPKHTGNNVGNSAGSADPDPVMKDTRSPLEKRRDAACETLGPKITGCAAEDAKANYEAGKVTKQQYEQDTATGVLKKNTEEFIKACKQSQYSSRQIRVLEVCQKEETECGPMLSCLDNLNKQ